MLKPPSALLPGTQWIPSSNSSGETERAPASFIRVSTRARRVPCSSIPISVRCREASAPSSSWERAARRRQRKRLRPNLTATSSDRTLPSALIQGLFRKRSIVSQTIRFSAATRGLGRGRAVEEVDLGLLAQDHVLHQVLERLGAPIATGWLDRFLQRFHSGFLAFDQGPDRAFGAFVEAQLGDVRRRLPPERDDLFDQAANVCELGIAEPGQLRAQRLRLDPRQARGHDRVLQSRAVLQLERGVEALDRLFLVELLFGVGHGHCLPMHGAAYSSWAASSGACIVVQAWGSGSTGRSQRSSRGPSRMRITRAGMPPTTAFAGTSLVTTELVPITELSPTLTPRRMQAP